MGLDRAVGLDRAEESATRDSVSPSFEKGLDMRRTSDGCQWPLLPIPFTECTLFMHRRFLERGDVCRWIGLDHGWAERAPCVLSVKGERERKGKSYLRPRRSAFSVTVQPSMAPNESLVERNETSTCLSPRILAPVA